MIDRAEARPDPAVTAVAEAVEDGLVRANALTLQVSASTPDFDKRSRKISDRLSRHH
jgi:hypothetical protein